MLNTETVREFFNSPFYLARLRHVIEIRAIVVQELLGTMDHARILDLGCGDGSLSIPFLGTTNEITLVDLSPRMLEIAAARIPEHSRARVNLINAALHEFEPRAPYDVVLCIGVLAHVPSIEAAIAKIAQCLKPGAVAILEFAPNPNPLGKVLFPYYAVRRAISGSMMSYVTNKIPLKRLFQITALHGLRLQRHRRHSFPVPTMSHWPYRWLYNFTLFTLHNPLLSKIGIEHIMLFTKEGGPPDPNVQVGL